jgi:hypothetical protein
MTALRRSRIALWGQQKPALVARGGLSTLGTNGGDERNRREQAQASASGLHQAYGWVVLLSTLPQFKLMLRGASRK